MKNKLKKLPPQQEGGRVRPGEGLQPEQAEGKQRRFGPRLDYQEAGERTSPGGAGPRSLTAFLRPNVVMGFSRYLLRWTGRRRSAQRCGM
jgi:hypothetical protein